jgi:hypothetical protein
MIIDSVQQGTQAALTILGLFILVLTACRKSLAAIILLKREFAALANCIAKKS